MTGNLNENAISLLNKLVSRSQVSRIASHRDGHLVDFGVNVRGGLESGLALARICLGGLGAVKLFAGPLNAATQNLVQVFTDQPALACMGSQYGGWPVKTDDYFAIGSGPIRLLRGKEQVLKQYGWTALPESGIAVLESGQLPDDSVIQYIASECGLNADQIFVCVAPTRSIAGTIQVVARSVEATMHKLFELGLDLTKVVSGFGTAPLPPVSGDDLKAIGRTNDAILYGGRVTLWVDMDDEEIRQWGPRIPSNSSHEFGRAFGEIFDSSGRDFYKLDPMLFSAAEVTLVSNLTGCQMTFGQTRCDILEKSFR